MSRWNPWATIRDLSARIAYLEGRLDEVCERAEEAETRAFHRASEHNYHRLRIAEERARALQEALVTAANLTIPHPIIFSPGRQDDD